MSKRKQQRITAIKINMYQLYLTASKNKQNLTEKKKTNYGNKSSKRVHKWESRISSNRDNFNSFSIVNYH